MQKRNILILLVLCLCDSSLLAEMKAASFAEFDHKARAGGEPLSVVFLGGSLTWGANASDPQHTSYRALMCWWLQEKYPRAPFTFHDAAIGGTGSDLAMFRLDHDVFSRKPDLMFLDFTVNDDAGGRDIERLASYECLLRRVIERGIAVEQVLLCFESHVSNAVDPEKLSRYQAHKKLSTAYGTALGDGMAHMRELVASGKADPKVIWPFNDGSHPDDPGYRIFFEAVRDGFEKAVADERKCIVPEQPVFPDMFKNRERILLAGRELPAGWHKAKTYRTAMWFDGLSSRWMQDVAVCSTREKEHAQPLRVGFTGTFAALLGEKNGAGPGFKARIDGKLLLHGKPQTDIWTNDTSRMGGGNLFSWIVLARELPPGKHMLEIEPVFDGSLPDGELRIESVCAAGQ